MAWSGVNDLTLYWTRKGVGSDWEPQRATSVLTPWTPALVQLENTLMLFYARGVMTINPEVGSHILEIYVTSLVLSLQQIFPGYYVDLLSARAPSAARVNNVYYVASRGAEDNLNIYWINGRILYPGTFPLFSPPNVNPSVGTSNGPALAAFAAPGASTQRLYMAWRGADDDQTIYWSRLNEATQKWEEQRAVPGAGTSNNPALAVFNGALYLVWNGGAFDSNIYWSVFDPGTDSWAARQMIPGVGTDKSPAAAAFDGRLYAAWKGVGDDKNIWWSTFDGRNWTNQTRIPGVGTDSGPALGTLITPPAPLSWWAALGRWLTGLTARQWPPRSG